MQKSNQNKKIIKLMSGVLAILTISSPTSLATKPIQLEDKPGILEKFKSFAWTAAIIGGAIIITGAIIYGISKIKESRSIEGFKRNLDLALKDITNKADVEYMLNEIKEMLVPKVENNRINEFEIRFAEFKTKVQTLDNINAAKRELLQGLHAIVKAFNVRFDTNEFNNLKSNKTGKNAEGSKHESNKPKLQLPSEFKVFKIAVIGSHIDGNKAMPHISRDGLNLNEFTVDKLCSCGLGEKLSDYDVANRDYNLKNEEIKLYENYPERLPKDSMLISRDGGWVALSFYYISNCAEAEKIIPECQYAICPFDADSDEIKGNIDDCELKKRLTELRDFIRQYNKTCDIRFLYYIDNIKQADDVGRYQRTISEFSRDLYNDDPKLALQQEVQSHSLSKENGQCYRECFNSILVSLGRKVEEFEQLPNKKVLKINYLEVLEKITFANELN